MSGISMAELHPEVIALLDDVDDGEVLDELSLSLVNLAAVASPTTLDLSRTAAAVNSAMDAGATPAQLQEVLVLVSCIGMHTLIGTSRLLADAVRRHDEHVLDAALGAEAARFACRRTRRTAPSRTFAPRRGLGARSRNSSASSSVSSWTRCRPTDSCRRSGSTSVRWCSPALVAARCVRCSTWRPP